MATLQNNIQKALSAGYTNEQIWERLQNDKRIKEAESKGYTSGQIRKRLGLDIPQVGVQPGIQPGIPKPMQPAGAPALPIQKPTVFDRTVREARKFEQPKATITPAMKEEARSFVPQPAEPATVGVPSRMPTPLGGLYEPMQTPQGRIQPIPVQDPRTQDIVRNAILQEATQDFPILSEAFRDLPYRGMTEAELAAQGARHIAMTTPGHMILAPARGMYEVGRQFTEGPISALFLAKDFDELFAKTPLGKIKIPIPGKKIGLGKDFEIPISTIPAFGARLLSSAVFWAGFSKVMGRDPIKYVMGDKEAAKLNDLKNAIDNHDWQKVGNYLKNDAAFVSKALLGAGKGQRSIRDILDQIKQTDPVLHKSLYDEMLSGRATGEVPITRQGDQLIQRGTQPGRSFPITGQQVGAGIQPTGLPGRLPAGISEQLVPGAIPAPTPTPAPTPVELVTQKAPLVKPKPVTTPPPTPPPPGPISKKVSLVQPKPVTTPAKEQEQSFFTAVDKWTRQSEDKILSDPFVSKDRKRKILDTRRERAKQKKTIPQEIARPKTEAEAKIPEGISTEVQQKVAHDLAKEAGILGKEYQKLAAETIGVSSTVQMSEGQAQNFIQKIDELIWKNENKILSSPFVSKDRRMKVLGDRVERVKQIGKSVTSDKFQKDADQLRKNLTALKKDPTKIKDIPDELLDPEKHKEATIFANFHRPGEEFRRDKEAYEFSDKIKEASVGMTETELKWKLEEAEVLKGLDKDDRIAVTMFRENMAGAPTTLTPKQAKYNDFLQKKYDFTHKLFEVPRYIKGYSPRMTSKDVKTAEERLLERFFGEINKAGFLKPGAIKVPGHINEWFKKRRIRKEPKDTELDASVIFHKYIHTGLKAMYFKDIIEEAKTIFPRLSRTSPKMEKLLEDYLFRMLGYPSVNDAAWTATVKDVHKVITTSPGLKQIFKAPGLRKIAAAEIDDEIARYIAKVLIDLGYIRTMGYRPTSFLKQMLQTLNNTVPQLGYSWTVMGLNDLMFGHGIKRASEDKIFHEFAPQLYKELSGAERSNWDKVRDNVMIFHGVGDKINRTIAHGAGIRKFNHYLPAYQKTKDIKKFLHRLEADKLNIRIQEKMEKALENDDTEKAKQIYFKELVDLTQYPYTKEESPMITQSPPGKMVYQLASWPINYADLMKTAVVNKNWKFFARQALMYTMIIGLASKATERKKRFVKRAIGLGPLKREIEFGVIPPSVEPMAKTLWMVGEFMEATINESFEPGSVKAWAKKNEKSLFTLKKYQPLIWKDIQQWLD